MASIDPTVAALLDKSSRTADSDNEDALIAALEEEEDNPSLTALRTHGYHHGNQTCRRSLLQERFRALRSYGPPFRGMISNSFVFTIEANCTRFPGLSSQAF